MINEQTVGRSPIFPPIVYFVREFRDFVPHPFKELLWRFVQYAVRLSVFRIVLLISVIDRDAVIENLEV